jgi:hypothetical protein
MSVASLEQRQIDKSGTSGAGNMAKPRIPSGLIDAINALECVAFIGAGFFGGGEPAAVVRFADADCECADAQHESRASQLRAAPDQGS